SRWNNYFLEGLDWLLRSTGMDGLYFDDVAFDRTVMKRIRKILDRHHPGCTIDLHSWNYFADNTMDDSSLAGHANSMSLYIDNFAFVDRLWFGEGFDYNITPDRWLIELSGIPFGMMGEMLQDGGNPWRGMVFGMSNRIYGGDDPTGLWDLWNEFRIRESSMWGFWTEDCPVRTGNPAVPCTIYRQAHRCLISLASWSEKAEAVRLDIDWRELGLRPEDAALTAPEVPGFQEKASFALDEPIPVPPGRGWVLLLE
ncbi:MAG: glycoside hydrolase domain-containing protein, partial [Oscillospiraceae bacterium]